MHSPQDALPQIKHCLSTLPSTLVHCKTLRSMRGRETEWKVSCACKNSALDVHTDSCRITPISSSWRLSRVCGRPRRCAHPPLQPPASVRRATASSSRHSSPFFRPPPVAAMSSHRRVAYARDTANLNEEELVQSLRFNGSLCQRAHDCPRKAVDSARCSRTRSDCCYQCWNLFACVMENDLLSLASPYAYNRSCSLEYFRFIFAPTSDHFCKRKSTQVSRIPYNSRICTRMRVWRKVMLKLVSSFALCSATEPIKAHRSIGFVP